MPRFESTRSTAAMRNRLLSTIFRHLPGAWIDPQQNELITLYRLRYKMALDEGKYDTALIFLNKIVELDPLDVEAKLSKADIYHHLRDVPNAIDQYTKVIRLTNNRQTDAVHRRAREAMTEIMEMLS